MINQKKINNNSLEKPSSTQPVRGFHDYFNEKINSTDWLLRYFNSLARRIGMISVTVPTVEERKIYEKTIGPDSTIVNKEIFTLSKNNNLVLRPELTSGIIRAVLNKFGSHDRGIKMFYSSGSCFRAERPQNLRYREFIQWNLEILWTNSEKMNYGPLCLFLQTINKDLLMTVSEIKKPEFRYNNLFLFERYSDFQTILKKSEIHSQLCNLCQKRAIKNNIYRIFDCSTCWLIIKNLQPIKNFFKKQEFLPYLNFAKIIPQSKVIFEKTLGRGLDYYSDLVFEAGWVEQNSTKRWISFFGGGSYFLDKFSSKFSPKTTGIGLAVGLERLSKFLYEQKFNFSEKLILNPEKISITVASKIESITGNQCLVNNLKNDSCLALFNFLVSLLKHNFSFNFVFEPSSKTKALRKAVRRNSDYFIFIGDDFQTNNPKIIYQKLSLNNKLIELLTLKELDQKLFEISTV